MISIATNLLNSSSVTAAFGGIISLLLMEVASIVLSTLALLFAVSRPRSKVAFCLEALGCIASYLTVYGVLIEEAIATKQNSSLGMSLMLGIPFGVAMAAMVLSVRRLRTFVWRRGHPLQLSIMQLFRIVFYVAFTMSYYRIAGKELTLISAYACAATLLLGVAVISVAPLRRRQEDSGEIAEEIPGEIASIESPPELPVEESS